jgi:drug/metabolite transporter (DMT)-like permease
MEPIVFAAVLTASACHATWNALVKAGGDPFVRIALVNIVSALCALVLLPFVPAPLPASWPFIVASVAVHQGYFLFLVQGYRSGDLSQVYPIARGVAPLLVALGGLAFAGERVAPGEAFAVALISAGVLSLAFAWRDPTRDHRAVLFALLTGLTIAAYTVVDGMGGRRAGAVVGYIVWMFVFDGVPFAIALIALRRGRLYVSMLPGLRGSVIGGALAFAAYGLVIWAMTRAPLTVVSALRETSVILAALIGTRVLHEPFGGRRIFAACLVTIGIVWLQIVA